MASNTIYKHKSPLPSINAKVPCPSRFLETRFYVAIYYKFSPPFAAFKYQVFSMPPTPLTQATMQEPYLPQVHELSDPHPEVYMYDYIYPYSILLRLGSVFMEAFFPDP